MSTWFVSCHRSALDITCGQKTRMILLRHLFAKDYTFDVMTWIIFQVSHAWSITDFTFVLNNRGSRDVVRFPDRNNMSCHNSFAHNCFALFKSCLWKLCYQGKKIPRRPRSLCLCVRVCVSVSHIKGLLYSSFSSNRDGALMRWVDLFFLYQSVRS